MAVDGSLIFDTKIDTRDFAKGTNTIKNQANGLKSTFVSLGKAIAGAFIIKKSIDLGKQATELASDLEEVQNVVDTAFGEMSDKMEQFAKTSVKSFGMSRLAAKQTGSTYMAMARNMIKSQEVASDMAVTLTGLTGDWASFYNVTTQEAATALNAIFTGETETIKRFGFIMTEANLQSYALSKGMKQRISDMTQEEKVLLRYNFIMEKSAMVQGDFAKTSGSWANQTRILKEQWKEFMTVLGQGIIQFLTPAIQFLNKAMQYMIALAKATGEVLSAVFGFNIEISDSASAVSSGAEDAADNITDIGDAAEEAGKKAAKAVAPFDKLNEVANAEITGNAFGGIDAINPEGVIEAGGAIDVISNGIGDVDDKIKKMVDDIKPVLQNIVDLFGKIKPLIIGIAEAFIAYEIVDWFMNLGGAIGALNPTAGVIALAVLAFGTIYDAIKDYNKKLVAEDLAGRFGDIALSLEEIETIAERLTTSKYSANIDVFVTEKQKLEQIEKGIKADVETLNKLDWKVSVGLALTEGEISQYKSTIESFIAHSNEYIDQQQYIVNLALKATITNDDNFLSEMTEAANLYYDNTRGEMEALGKKLREAYDLAFADGVLDSKEQELIWNIRKEMTDVMQKAADLEFQAQLKKLSIDYGDTELTAESWKNLTKKIQDLNKTRIEGLEEAELVSIQSIMMQYNLRLDEAKTEEERLKITSEMNDKIAQYADEVSQTKAIITLQGMDVQLDSLIKSYQDELDNVVAPATQKAIRETYEDAMALGFQDVYEGDPYELPMDLLCRNMADYWEKEIIDTIPEATRKGAARMYAELEPTEAELKKIFDDAIAAGSMVPEGVSDGLTDIAKIKAINGDLDAINFLLGQKLSTDPSFLDALGKSEKAGQNLNDYFIAGMKSKILDLKKSGEDLVLTVDGAITKEANIVKKTTIPTSAGAIIGGFGNKFTKDKTTKSAVKTWLDGINNMILNYKMDTVKIRAEFFGMELPGITGSKQNYLKYPQYASGNVIPANYGNFLATLGDNKREPEVVSPLSTMKQAMKEAMAEMGGAGGEYTFIAQLDGKNIFKETVKQDKMHKNTTGKSAFSY